MKLAKVDHYRCGEPAGKWGLATYVWIPENMSEHQFGVLCETARNNYLANEREWSEAAPAPPPGYGATVQGYPDTMTVSEVKADHAAKTKAYKEHGEKQALSSWRFSDPSAEARSRSHILGSADVGRLRIDVQPAR